MKWFNLSLLLVAIALSAVLVLEPMLLTRWLVDEHIIEEPLPKSLASIETLDELSVPLALIPNPPTVQSLPAVQPVPTNESDPSGQAQTRELKPVVFAGQQLDSPIIEEVAQAISDPEPAVTDNQPAAGNVCYQYGPLEDFDQVTAAGELIINEGITDQWAEIEMPYSQPRYWVVLDEARSPQQARDWVQKLDEKKFGDHYLPFADDEPHLISLGIFKTIERAERHHKALQAAGFPVKLRPKAVELTRRWITFSAGADGLPLVTTALTRLGVTAAQAEFCNNETKQQAAVAGQ